MRKEAADLVAKLGVAFRSDEILELALTHRSHAHEVGVPGADNERLEILGDAVLGLCVTELLYRRFPHYAEGDLAKLRASLVSTVGLAEVAKEIGLGDAILLGRGESMSGGREKSTILADCLEAVIGALHVDRGITASRQLVRRLFEPRIDGAAESGLVPKDPKTNLQEVLATRTGQLPVYTVRRTGPDHSPKFTANVLIAGENAGTGTGKSKKEAQRAAAASALMRLETEAADSERSSGEREN